MQTPGACFKGERQLLVFLAAVTTVLAQFYDGVLPAYNDCNDCKKTCPKNKIYRRKPLAESEELSCLACECIDLNPHFMQRFVKTHLVNEAFLLLEPPVPELEVDDTVTISCVVWHDVQREISLVGAFSLSSQKDVLEHQLSLMIAVDNATTLTVLNLTLPLDASTVGDTVKCTPRFRGGEGGGGGGGGTKLFEPKYRVFGLKQTTPVITGPEIVVPEKEASWKCSMEFVAISHNTDEVEFALEILQAGYLHVNDNGATFLQKEDKGINGREVEQEVKLMIPPRLMNTRLQLQCTSIHRLVNVTTRSKIFAVHVTKSDKMKQIGTVLTTVGVVLGCLGVLVIAVFGIYVMVCNSSSSDIQAAAAAASAAPPPLTQSILKKQVYPIARDEAPNPPPTSGQVKGTRNVLRCFRKKPRPEK